MNENFEICNFLNYISRFVITWFLEPRPKSFRSPVRVSRGAWTSLSAKTHFYIKIILSPNMCSLSFLIMTPSDRCQNTQLEPTLFSACHAMHHYGVFLLLYRMTDSFFLMVLHAIRLPFTAGNKISVLNLFYFGDKWHS